ncbi:hypothetical protein ABZ471_40390 [Streptomyces sp. NPDC005728]|uniref:tRNA adenosine deaminase-associated protein n=1 Tax=Streptomyces sp. NPDC005728 TaxID=3157054 RepID=UPI0033D0493C
MHFSAFLVRTPDGWEASEAELDDVETLPDLADLAREASPDETTVLLLIEQEDAWFGIVRVDGENDPRIYVSDAAAASRSRYGEILLTDELLGGEPDIDGDDLDALGPVGDTDILDDLGVSRRELLSPDVDGMAGIAEYLGDAVELTDQGATPHTGRRLWP